MFGHLYHTPNTPPAPEPIHDRKARTFEEILASGDVKITHEGKPYWGLMLCTVLSEEDFETVMAKAIDNKDDHQ